MVQLCALRQFVSFFFTFLLLSKIGLPYFTAEQVSQSADCIEFVTKTKKTMNERKLFRCSNKSKTASASEKPNLFELFRAPKVFEAKPQ